MNTKEKKNESVKMIILLRNCRNTTIPSVAVGDLSEISRGGGGGGNRGGVTTF